jgi:hypothetical protein
VKAEQAQLLKKNKVQLKKEARDLNVKVNFHVNGASYDAPKEVIAVQLYPAVASMQQVEDEGAINRITANDNFHWINNIFSGELAKVARKLLLNQT